MKLIRFVFRIKCWLCDIPPSFLGLWAAHARLRAWPFWVRQLVEPVTQAPPQLRLQRSRWDSFSFFPCEAAFGVYWILSGLQEGKILKWAFGLVGNKLSATGMITHHGKICPRSEICEFRLLRRTRPRLRRLITLNMQVRYSFLWIFALRRCIRKSNSRQVCTFNNRHSLNSLWRPQTPSNPSLPG
jgi:hypothetical protein